MSKKQYKKGNNKKLSCHTQNFRRKPSVQTYAFLVGSPDWNRSGDCLGFVIGLFHHHIGTELGVEIGDGLFQQLSRILLHNGLIDGTLQRLDAKFLAKSFDGKARVELPRAQVDEISCRDGRREAISNDGHISQNGIAPLHGERDTGSALQSR